MDNEIQLISDGEGLAVIGNVADVDRFLVSEGLSSKDLGLQRFTSVVGTGAAFAQTGVEIAAESGRWVKLTGESARLVKKYGLRESSRTGLSTGVVKGNKGQIKGFVEFAKGPRSLLSNPAALAGAAGIMAQIAMQQTMDEITDYLAMINEKVDDVLRAQKDAVLARMIGVGFVIEEAMILREKRGRVDEVTWSKVHSAPATIAETQAYALRQLDALAEKMERKAKIGDLAAAAREAESAVREWLAVLARCFQLQDAIAVLELDRVLDASPEELNGHRLGLKAARQQRLDHIARSTERLVARMNAAADTANAKVLLHPTKSPAVVQSSNHVATGVHDFHGRLGIESGRQSSEARRWVAAAVEARDKALETGAKGVGAARSFGNETLDRAGSVKGRLSSGIAERTRRRRGDGAVPEGEPRDEEVRDEEVRDRTGRREEG
ncbi:hypothetical protein [Streptomyces sp. NPDC002057]|uniref:hypothetical protein n=1 Tax=Streptomyces sp. NPDC002057 TaxID=3154664 RepID=UPI00332C11A2